MAKENLLPMRITDKNNHNHEPFKLLTYLPIYCPSTYLPIYSGLVCQSLREKKIVLSQRGVRWVIRCCPQDSSLPSCHFHRSSFVFELLVRHAFEVVNRGVWFFHTPPSGEPPAKPRVNDNGRQGAMRLIKTSERSTVVEHSPQFSTAMRRLIPSIVQSEPTAPLASTSFSSELHTPFVLPSCWCKQ